MKRTNQNRRVLIFVDYFLPGDKAGGIVRSVHNLVENVAGIDFFVVTRNRDLGSRRPYTEVPSNTWIRRPSYKIIYLSRGRANLPQLLRLIQSVGPDDLYLNCIYSVGYHMLPVLIGKLFYRKPRILMAANGMLSKGALSIKRFKKAVFLKVVRFLGLYRGVHWHATSAAEKADIQRIFGRRTKVSVAPYIVDLAVCRRHFRRVKHKGDVRIFFFSRISEKKNLLGALRLLKHIEACVRFKIIGPIEDRAYYDRCLAAIRDLPPNIHVEYIGRLPFHKILSELQKHHFLLLPTLHENFGHVIVESLLAGCPVIISDQTAFRGLRAAGVGWDVPLDAAEAWVEIIERCSAMGQAEFDRMSGAAMRFGEGFLDAPGIVRANRVLFGVG